MYNDQCIAPVGVAPKFNKGVDRGCEIHGGRSRALTLGSHVSGLIFTPMTGPALPSTVLTTTVSCPCLVPVVPCTSCTARVPVIQGWGSTCTLVGLSREHLTAAGCVGRSWAQEMRCSPARSAHDCVLGLLSSYRKAEKIH